MENRNSKKSFQIVVGILNLVAGMACFVLAGVVNPLAFIHGILFFDFSGGVFKGRPSRWLLFGGLIPFLVLTVLSAWSLTRPEMSHYYQVGAQGLMIFIGIPAIACLVDLLYCLSTPVQANPNMRDSTERPVWVWIIAVFFFPLGGGALLVLFTETVTLNQVFETVSLVIGFVGAIQLVRLHRSATRFFLFGMVIYALEVLFQIFTGHGGQIDRGAVISNLIMYTIPCLYAWRLQKIGRLK